MLSRNPPTKRLGAIMAATGAALGVAACGSTASTKSSSSAGRNAASTASSAAVKTAKGPLGTHLVGPSGRTLYLWVADSKNKSRCSGACAAVWPPLTAKGRPTGAGAVHASLLGTTSGHKQVTYDGHPLYYYTGDSHPGTTAGQGINGFGAKWWVVSPTGAAITRKNAASGGSASAPSSSSSTSASGY